MTCGRQSPQEKALIAVTMAFTDAALRLAAAALLAVFVLVIVGALTAGQTAGARVAVAVIFGVVIALCVWLWVRVIRRCGHLEIAGQVITYVDGKGQTMTLSR